ncbi:MAG: hypothetical protein RIS08_1057 [Actinomycetota bacterium]
MLVGLLVSSLLRPLPEYLVAATDLKPGEMLTAADFTAVSLDLGELDSYVRSQDVASVVGVGRVVRQGELLAKADINTITDSEYTAIRITPALKPASVTAGSFVSVWRAIERESGTELELIVPRSEVLEIKYGEGLFAQENPEVELRLKLEEAIALMHAVSLENQIYVVPVI